MYIIAESPIDAIRADFRRINQSSMLHRVWHAVATHRERAVDRAVASGVRQLGHAGVVADYEAARRFR